MEWRKVAAVLALVFVASVVTVVLGFPWGDHNGESDEAYKTQYVNDSLDIFVRSNEEVGVRVGVNLTRNRDNETVLSETYRVNETTPAQIRNVTDRVGLYTLEVNTTGLNDREVVEVCRGRGSVRVVVSRDEIEIVQGHIDYFSGDVDYDCKLDH